MKKLAYIYLTVLVVVAFAWSGCGKKNTAPIVTEQTKIAPDTGADTGVLDLQIEAEKKLAAAKKEYAVALDKGLKEYLVSAAAEIDTAQKSYDAGAYKDSVKESSRAIELINEAYAQERLDKNLQEKARAAQEYLDAADAILTKAQNKEVPKYAGELYDIASKFYSAAKKELTDKKYDDSISSSKKAIETAQKAIDRAAAEQASEQKKKAEEKNVENANKKYANKKMDKYDVVSGDCLWNISKKPIIYGTPLKWKQIWFSNQDQIIDPDLIYPKQEFNIPR